ncbi:glycosyltransferase family 33 protein [Amanita muscaria Koide BX008]|uniref:Chitobiosyldiphosphodolichol beta-mannosyltransferase n=1 Tax=Amanita muscaria (strain Koide BX008) TaxID=946122 RepID=A0A0C2XN78_AMAMK|nr:glycosyltransferase family 33 protein [Amanita muscaria Koide BX008]
MVGLGTAGHQRDVLESSTNPKRRSAAVLVLGDIGRSPRTMYHAQSFAENDFDTHLIGYGGSRPLPSLETFPLVHVHYLWEPPEFLRRLPFVLSAPVKVLQQIFAILYVLIVRISEPPEFILVQNPPSIPTLALAQAVARLRSSKLIIDWHNLGYSILALKLGTSHTFVKVAKRFEATFGRSAYAHLFVTRVMRDHLMQEWDLKGRKCVLYDRPPRHFHRCSSQEVHELFRKLQVSLCAQKALQDFLPEHSAPHSTPLTYTAPQVPSTTGNIIKANASPTRGVFAHRVEIATPSMTPTPAAQVAATDSLNRLPVLRPDRPALLVSSTSWTEDEDFGILLDALNMYNLRAEERAKAGTSAVSEDLEPGLLPKVLVIVTGKGPLKGYYMEKIDKLQNSWSWVRCISLWLEVDDYPTLLGSADLGICLHASSSAMDLPMKVVDMFGCGLPVCALDFPCIGELVRNGINGLTFKNAAQLAEQLETLLLSFPDSAPLQDLRSHLSSSHAKSRASKDERSDAGKSVDAQWEWTSWDENWNRVMKPLVLK